MRTVSGLRNSEVSSLEQPPGVVGKVWDDVEDLGMRCHQLGSARHKISVTH
jgi:hypothetical protein